MKRERGQALLIVLALLGIGAVLLVPFLQMANSAAKGRQMFGQYINEDYAADAAVNYGMWRLQYQTGFAQSLPLGQPSAPFYITLNGVQASTTVTAQASSVTEPNGQALAGFADANNPWGRQAYPYKLTKTVSATSTYATIAADGFESHSGSGGTGNWTGSWTLAGNYQFSNSSSYEGSYNLMLKGPAPSGSAQRRVNLSSANGTSLYLDFWARADSFQSGDTAQVKVSTDGTNWTVLNTFDHTDSDNQWHLYQYDITSYGKPASFYVAFTSNLGTNWWQSRDFRIDALSFTSSQSAITIQPGVYTVYTYIITIQCMDPNGGTPLNNEDVRRIIDDLPDRNATSGNGYLQYINGSTQWDAADWGFAPFDPNTITTTGSGTNYHQHLEWNFRDAGYSDVAFAYGQTRTITFQAGAPLTTGVYANTVGAALRSSSYPVITAGSQAPFTVGSPSVTGVPGALLTITKTGNPPIIYPNIPTTVTYTIDIKNNDTVPVPIYEVQDWLPSTGDNSSANGFIYVPKSAYGKIFNTSNVTTPQLFYDGFNDNASNTVPYWTDSDGAGTNVATNGQQAALTIPSYWGNQFMVTANSSIGSMTASSYRAGMIFTAQTTQTVTKIRVYVDAKFGTSPTYRFGLQAGNYGSPSGSWLGGGSNYGSLAPTTTGWQTITLPTAVSLTAGNVYHIVVQYSSGTINSSNYIALRCTTPGNNLYPYNGVADSQSDTEWYNGFSWSQTGYQPVYLLQTATPTYEGNPYETSTSQSIYGANYTGEQITISGGDQMVSTIGFYVRQNTSTDPLDNLSYQIRDGTNTVISSGTLVIKTAITTSYAWYDAVLSSPVPLTNGVTYTVDLYSTNTNSTDYYQVLRNENANSAEYNGTNYNGANSFYTNSSTSGGSWSPYYQYDIPFRMTPDASITESGISTAGYTGIQLSYDRWRSGSGSTNPVLLVQWKPSANTTWNTLENTAPSSSQPGTQTWNLPVGASNTAIDIRFTNLTVSTYQILIDNVKVISIPLVPFTPVGMPDTDANQHHFFYNPNGHGTWWGLPQYPFWLRWELDWTFVSSYTSGDGRGQYPASDDPIWDHGNGYDTYPYHDYSQNGLQGLWLNPGETFEIQFQAAVNLKYYGSYFDEVFVRVPNQGNNQEWLYSWPTGAVSVPMFDIAAKTLNSILQANAMLTPTGHWYRSWHWLQHR